MADGAGQAQSQPDATAALLTDVADPPTGATEEADATADPDVTDGPGRTA